MSTKILLIDDDEIDADFTRRMLQRETLETEFFHVRDGVEGLRFLRCEGDYADRPRPDLVLLDLHMPRMDGRTFLTMLRQDESLKKIPVAVLLASQEYRETDEGFATKVDASLVKPIERDEFIEVMNRLGIIRS